MDRRRFLTASAISVGAVVSAVDKSIGAEVTGYRAKLIGCWSLLDAVTMYGEKAEPWLGRATPMTGTLLYHDNGWMSAQISGAKPAVASQTDFEKLSEAEKLGELSAYYAYYAQFEIDDVERIITHRVVDSMLPYEKGVVYRRNFELEGDILKLKTAPKEFNGRKYFNLLNWKKIA